MVTCLLLTTRSVQEIRSYTTNDNNQTSYKIEVRAQLNTRKERDSYLLCEGKLDMEMPPDTLEGEDYGVNELFVVVLVDASFTTEHAASDSLGTHRSISSMISVNSGDTVVSLIVLTRGSIITHRGIIINLIDRPLLDIPEDYSTDNTYTRIQQIVGDTGLG